MTIGVVFHQFGWHVARCIRSRDGRRFFDVALALAPRVFHLDHAVAVGACRGVVTMFALVQHGPSKLLAWGRRGNADSVVHYSPEGGFFIGISRHSFSA